MRYLALEEFSNEIERIAKIENIRAVGADKFSFEIISFTECNKLLVCMQKYFYEIGNLIVDEKVYGEDEIEVTLISFECKVRYNYI